MKLTGQHLVTMSPPEDEIAHKFGTDVDWQESVVIYTWDVEQQCYVYFRIGHEPNHGDKGLAVVWCNIWTPEKYYKRYETFDLTEESRTTDGFGGGGLSRYVYDGKHNWTVRDGDIGASLVLEDFHQPFDFFPKSNNLGEIAHSHFEASGRVTGTIDFQGKTYTLKNAVGYRDHSWGIRKWPLMRSWRWIPAIFGEELVTQLVSMVGPDWTLRYFGYVIRNGEISIPKKLKVLTDLDADGITQAGGTVEFTLDSDEIIEISFRNVAPAGMSFHYGQCGCEAMAIARCGDLVGVGAFTTGNNTMGGAERPPQNMLLNGFIDNGIYDYQHGSPSVVR